MSTPTAKLVAQELQLTNSARRPVYFHGLSMWPFLREGDHLTVEPVVYEAIRVGDIVTCRRDDKFPTYRVVKKEPRQLTLRGDNWPNHAYVAEPDNVLGRVVRRDRDGGSLAREGWRWRLTARLRTGAFGERFRFVIAHAARRLGPYRAAVEEQVRQAQKRAPA